MRQSHPDIQTHPSEFEKKEMREQTRRKAQRALMEEPYIYHKLERKSYYDENGKPTTERVWHHTVDLRKLTDDPKQLLRIQDKWVSEKDFNIDDIDDVENYTNDSDMNMSPRVLVLTV